MEKSIKSEKAKKYLERESRNNSICGIDTAWTETAVSKIAIMFAEEDAEKLHQENTLRILQTVAKEVSKIVMQSSLEAYSQQILLRDLEDLFSKFSSTCNLPSDWKQDAEQRAKAAFSQTMQQFIGLLPVEALEKEFSINLNNGGHSNE